MTEYVIAVGLMRSRCIKARSRRVCRHARGAPRQTAADVGVEKEILRVVVFLPFWAVRICGSVCECVGSWALSIYLYIIHECSLAACSRLSKNCVRSFPPSCP